MDEAEKNQLLSKGIRQEYHHFFPKPFAHKISHLFRRKSYKSALRDYT
jgi:hypothetical protein